MQTSLNKSRIAAAIAIVLIATSIGAIAIPAQAALSGTPGGTPSTYEYSTTKPANGTSVTFGYPDVIAYLSVSPHTIGIGQTMLVNLWITVAPAAERQYQHYTVTFTKPDGTTDAVGPMKSYEADGTAWFEYVVDQVGQWHAVFTFPGQFFPAGNYSNGVPYNGPVSGIFGAPTYPDTYIEPATSQVVNFTVQSEPVMSWYSPLPTGYWTRPISMNNREWNAIAGNYPWDQMRLAGSMNGAPSYLGPYVTVSKTAHVVWSRQDAFPVGIIGAEAGNYGNKGSGQTPSLIFEGRCYQTRTVQWYNGSFISCAICYDLRTGQMYYMNPTAAPFNGLTPTWIEYNLGTSAEVTGGGDVNTVTASLKLISGNFMYVINPQTGAISNNITLGGLTASVRYSDWALFFQTNNTALFTGQGSAIIKWSTRGTSTNYTGRILSNVTNAEFRSLATGGVDLVAMTNVVQTRFTIGNQGGGRLTGYSLASGKMLWNVSTHDSSFNPGTNCADQGKYFDCYENGIVRAYDALTGKQLWETHTDYPWGEFWTYNVASGPIDPKNPTKGVFIADSYAGTYAFDWDTGAIVWRSSHEAVPFETPYNVNGTAVYPGTGSPIIGDGVMYVQSNEHTPTAPYERGFGTYCVNMTTGALLWKLDEPMVIGGAAEGYSTMNDQYGGTMYVLGMGQSQTTVSAPGTAIALGQSVVLTGTVTDLSPAQPGAACVSEQSMGAYMSYLHLQSQLQNQLHPEAPTGVPVSIDAIDPNGNYVHIGDTNTSIAGAYSYMWTPNMEGKYDVTVTFGGSPSYSSSWAQTAVGVSPAPAAVTFPEIPTPADYSGTLNIILAAVVVAIVLALVAIVLTLRKK